MMETNINYPEKPKNNNTHYNIPKPCNHINKGKNELMEFVCLDCGKILGYFN